MKHLFVSYPQALLAKEKGWQSDIKDIRNEQYIYAGWWFADGSSKEPHAEWITEIGLSNRIGAPLYPQITDWFRDKHNLYINIYQNGDTDDEYVYRVYDCKYPHTTRGAGQGEKHYYTCLSKAIEEAFKLI